MKTAIALAGPLLASFRTCAQTPQSPAGSGISSGVVSDYAVAQRGLTSRLWQRVIGITNALGRVRFETNSFTELESGMAYVDPNTGQLEASVPAFQITPDGHAVALRCQHQLIVSPDLTDPNGAGYPAPAGSHNGFYNASTFGSSAYTTSVPPLQSVGAASCYLTSGSSFHGVGTTAVDPALLTELAAKTTYPPAVYYAQDGDILTDDLYLSPQVPRDTASAPDLGFHYDPLDYAFGHVWLTNATISIAPGTAIATFATTAGYYGLCLAQGSRLYCQGSPTEPVRIARYDMVQEQSTGDWSAIGPSIMGGWYSGVPPRATFRFTDWYMPAQDSYNFESDGVPMANTFQDCDLHGGKFYVDVPSLGVTNCLFERVGAAVDDSGVGIDISPVFRNCLWFGGQLNLTHWDYDTWTFRDNLFDQCAITQDGNVDGNYNGYTTGSARLTPNDASDKVASLAYQTGPLGDYYQPSTSAFINAGSTAAGNVGLYHYTTQTNETKEATSTVDIGLHYVALDAYGNPVDTDGGGVADFIHSVINNAA
jgi:hypothetical protein